jgi:signal transduction histidine kinase
MGMARDLHDGLLQSLTGVSVQLEMVNRQITVTDDGRGFPFRGHYDLPALTTMNLGLMTLKERIVPLGGSLAIDSTEAGARLHISLPLARSGTRSLCVRWELTTSLESLRPCVPAFTRRGGI